MWCGVVSGEKLKCCFEVTEGQGGGWGGGGYKGVCGGRSWRESDEAKISK
jgi:hypothetical protein